jgi:hypothetical protein
MFNYDARSRHTIPIAAILVIPIASNRVPLSREAGLSSKGLDCPEAFYFFFFSCLGAE